MTGNFGHHDSGTDLPVNSRQLGSKRPANAADDAIFHIPVTAEI